MPPRNLHHKKKEVRGLEWEAFRDANERVLLRNIAYFIIFVVVAFMTFINLIYCVKFSTSQKKAWIIGIFTGLFAGASAAVLRCCLVC